MLTVLAPIGLVGCGGSEEDWIKLVRVSGTVTKNGKPMADADVSFVPEIGNKDSTPGVDRTGPEGGYLLMFKGRTGVAPGKYRVTITPAVELPTDPNIPPEFKNDPMMFQFAQEARLPVKKAGSKGSKGSKEDVFKNEFGAEVPEGSSVTLDFDVKASSSAGSATKK